MALKDIVAKGKQVHTTTLHGGELKFCELGFEEEIRVKKVGEERATNGLKDATPEEKSDYATLYSYYTMLKKGGDDTMVDDFYALPKEYHREIMMAINLHLSDKVHTEAKRFEDQIRQVIKDKALAK